MAISYIGGAVGTTTATIPAHQAGDLIVAFAFRSGSTTLPTLPTGWTSIQTGAAQTAASRLAYRVATDNTTTTGTWTNAGRLVIHVYRGATTPGASVAPSTGASTTVTFPALTLQQAGSSWVARFAGHRTSTNLPVPTGSTQRQLTGNTPIAAGNDSNGTVASNPTATNVTVNASSGWHAYTVELRDAPPTGDAAGTFTYEGTAVGSTPAAASDAVVVDDFTGTDGTAWSTVIWNKTANPTPTATIQGNMGRLATGTVGAYSNADKIQVRNKTPFTEGEVSFQMTFRDILEAQVGCFAYVVDNYLPDYAFYPPGGYGVEFNTGSKALWLKRYVGEVPTNLVTTTATAAVGANPVVGDTWNVAIRSDATLGVRAWVWKDGTTRPTTANLTPGTIDTTYTSGLVGAGIQGGNGTTPQRVDFDNITYDPTPDGAVTIPTGTATGTFTFTGAASGATTRAGAATGTFTFTGAATATVARTGTATGTFTYTGASAGTTTRTGAATGTLTYTGAAAGTAPALIPGELDAPITWADEFTTLDVATPATVNTARWRPNDVWQNISRGYRDFAGTSWNLNPNETLNGAPRSAFSTAGSVLTIKAIRTPTAWNTDIVASMTAQGQSPYVAPAWSGGMLITNPVVKKFKYGHFAIRARFPTPGKGMFPALWLFATDGNTDPLDKGGAEIDLFEVFGHAAGRPWNITTHYRNNANTAARTSVDVAAIDTDTTAWHVYGVDWQPGWLRFYKDGVQVAELTGVDASWFNTDMGIRINYAMDASWFGSNLSDASTPDELSMDVDWVRVYDTTVTGGTGSGTLTFTGSATGATSKGGTAAGTVTYTATATGATTKAGTATGAFTYTGTATGATTRSGAATGSVTYTGAAVGASTRTGTTTGTLAWSGTATGASSRAGTGGGTVAYTGNATGAAPVVGGASGFATGALTYTGAAVGSTVKAGTGAGAVLYVGTAGGTAPTITPTTGAAVGQTVYVGTATGARNPAGAANGTIAWGGTSTGATPRGGTSTGALTWVGAAVGTNITALRDITITVTGPTGHTFTVGSPTGRTLRIGAPTGRTLTIDGPGS